MLAIQVVVLMVCGVVTAAPVPKDRQVVETYYYPTTAKTKLIYDCHGDDIILVVTEVKNIKSGKQVTVERRDLSEPVVQEVVEVSTTGLIQRVCPVGALEPPLTLLRLPARPGDHWKFKLGANEGTEKVIGIEKIKVPAGTFEAVRVDWISMRGGQIDTTSRWYAQNVGLVQMSDNGKPTWTLKSLTLPKD